MKKWIFLIVTVLFSSFAFSDTQCEMNHRKIFKPQKFNSSDFSYLHPDSVLSNALVVKAMSLQGFYDGNLNKMEKAFELLERVVNSDEFKDRVINFKNTKGERAFASNKGLSNEQIYQIFMEGRETLRPNTPGEMNFDLRLYNRSWSRVIGYTTPDTNLININWKYFKNFGAHEVAANLAHEWTHKIGFDHTSAAEHDSAPYAIGYIIEEIAAKLVTSPIQKVAQQ